MIVVAVNDQAVAGLVRSLVRALANAKPAMRDVGEYVTEATKRRFVTGTGPDGERWAPNSPVTIGRMLGQARGNHKKDGSLSKAGARRVTGKKPLVGETRSLATTIHYRAYRDSVEIGSPMIYSGTQQLGAKKGSFGRTRRGTPIPWGDIPARPFIGLSDKERANVAEILLEHLMRAAFGRG